MASCPWCGQDIFAGETACRRCGHALAPTTQPPPDKSQPQSTSMLWLGLVGGVVVLGLLVLAVLLDWVPTLAPQSIEPTLAVTPTPTRNTAASLNPVVSQVLVSPQVWDHDALHELIDGRWYASEDSFSIDEGHLRIAGVQPWASWWGSRRTFEGGDAALVLFRPGPGSQFEFHLERGEWATGDYRRWAFHVGTRFEMAIVEGAEPPRWGELVGQLRPEPETWYCLLLGIGANAEFLTYLWDCGETEPQLAYRRQMDRTWEGAGWVLGAGANRGTVDIDAVTEIAFVRPVAPTGAEAHFWAALAHLDQGDHEDALAELDAAILLEPDDSSYYYYRGMTRWAAAQDSVAPVDAAHLDAALADLEQAESMDPDNDEYHRQLAWFHAQERDDLVMSELYITLALTLAPLEARNYRLRALVLRDLEHDPAAALVDLANAIELSPRESELYRLRGETYNLMGNYASGLADGLECAALQPEDAACYLQQARSHVGLDDADDAVAAYGRFLETTDREVCPGCRQEAEAYIAQHP